MRMFGSSHSAGRRRARIYIVSQLFDPEPTFKGLKFAKALKDGGSDVEVVTGFPNYPGGKIYEGYRIRPLKRETMSGVRVTRLAIYPDHGRRALRRIICYVSFMVTALVYLLINVRRGDIIYVFYPSLTAGFAALGARLFHGARIVVDIQDVWPDSLTATGMIGDGLMLRIIGSLCDILYKASDRIIVLSIGFRDLLVSRGVSPDKIRVIYNWAEESESPVVLATCAGPQTSEFSVLFAGNMGVAQGLETILDAAALVERVRPNIRFNFMGSGVEAGALQARAAAQHPNVRFLPRVALGDVGAHLRSADCLLVHLKDDPLFAITIPSKTQAYLYAGRPIVMAVRGEAAGIIERAGAGLVACPEDAAGVARRVIELHDMAPECRAEMGRRGRAFYEEHMSFDRGLAAFRDLVAELDEGHQNAPASRARGGVDESQGTVGDSAEVRRESAMPKSV